MKKSQSPKIEIAKIVDKIKLEIQNSITKVVKRVLSKIRDEIHEKVNKDINFTGKKLKLRTICETEQLKTYIRRDNLKKLRVREEIKASPDGRTISEDCEVTMSKVLEVAHTIDAKFTQNDITIAHRLPAGKSVIRPIIVKFSRRVAKSQFTSTRSNS